MHGVARTVTFGEAALLYLEKGGSERYLDALIVRFGDRKLASMTALDIAAAARDLYPDAKPATVVRQLYTPMNAVLRRAAKDQLCPLMAFDKPTIAHDPVTHASESEVAAVLAKANPQLAAILTFMTYTGRRVGEAVALIWRDVDLARGHVTIVKTKSGKPHRVALHPNAHAAIAGRRPNIIDEAERVFGYASRYSVRTGLARVCRRLGIRILGPHQFGRHTFAARLLADGHSIKVLKDAGGWASIDIVDRHYGHLEHSHADAAVRSAGTKPTQPASIRPTKVLTFKRKA